MNIWQEVIATPLGPPLLLGLGGIVLAGLGRWMRRPLYHRGTALFFVALAGILQLYLRNQPVVPEFSRAWQPLLQRGTNLLWIGDGWNWYVASLILLLGAAGVLLFGASSSQQRITQPQSMATARDLALHMGTTGAAVLFVGSGNLLTATLTWVLMDGLQLSRFNYALNHPKGGETPVDAPAINRAQGLSLLGALLLLIGLLPAGPSGPGQPLQGGSLPVETVALMLGAAALRAGAYPFHLWLLPTSTVRMTITERMLDHMIPALCGLWLLGWAVSLGGKFVLLQPIFLALVLLALLGSALAAWTATEQPGHTSFVLVTSVGVAGLAGALSPLDGPDALIWPVTAFALGGGLWLVGERVWQEWGWQIPVSVGALALVGGPFTPGFLTQPFLARLATLDSVLLPFFLTYILAQTLQVAALLRSWGAQPRDTEISLRSSTVVRLMGASMLLALPLVIAGIYPQAIAALASLPEAIPADVGNPPTAVAGLTVWLTLGVPLLLGIGVSVLRPRFWGFLGRYPDYVSRFASLEWLAEGARQGIGLVSTQWSRVFSIFEGAGYVGWATVFLLTIYLLFN